MSSNPFEERMRERLSGSEIPPRPEVWTQLEDRLRRENRRDGFFWLFFDGAMSLLLLSGFLLLGNNGSSSGLREAKPLAEIQTESVIAGHSIAVIESDCETTEATETAVLVGKSQSPARIDSQPAQASVSRKTQARTEQFATYGKQEGKPDLQQKQAANFPVQQPVSPQPITLSATPSPGVQTPFSTRSLERIQPTLPFYDLQSPPVAVVPAGGRKIPFGRPSRWAWRFSLTPERAFEVAGSALQDQDPPAPVPVDLNALFDVRTQSSNVLYGNYSAPNTDIYYRVTYPKNALTANLQAEYFLRPRLSLSSGLTLTLFGEGHYEEGILIMTDGMPYDPLTSTPTTTDLSLGVSSSTDFQTVQIGVPLQLNYYLQRGRSSWVLSGGLSVAQQLSWGVTRSRSDRENSLNPNTVPDPVQDLGSFYAHSLQTHASFRILYERQLSTRLAWYVGPSLKYQLNNTSSRALGQSPLRYRAGLEVGVRIGPGR